MANYLVPLSALLSLFFLKASISVKCIGLTRPLNERTEIKPALSGIIENLLVKEGDTVRQGHLLATIKDNISSPKLLLNEFELSQRQGFIHDLELLLNRENYQKLPLQTPLYRQQLSRFLFQLSDQQAAIKKIAREQEINNTLIKETLDVFQEKWSGVIVLILPDDSFVAGKQKISNAERFWQLIRPHSSIMVQALVGALVYTILGLSTSIYMQKIIDFVLVEGNVRLLNLLSVGMIFILIFQLIIGGYKTVFGLQTGQMIDARLILGYYKHLLKLPQRFFDTMRVGEIISRVNDAVSIREFINNVALNFIVNGLIVLFSIVLMFFYYWKLALIMLAIIPIYLVIYWISNKVNKKWQRRLMEEGAELESQLVESLNAVGTIKRFGLESYSNDKTEGRFVTLLRTIYKTSIYSLYIGTGSEFFTRLFTIILLWAGSYFVINRELSPGELLSFYALIGYFTGPASSLIGANKSIQDALIAADRLFEIIDLETEASDENKVK